ncbi:MAG: class III signal peptide-containing protein [Candidatus Diapherotrites archaeon]
MLNRFKGQGALEYLLLIGGAVVVAAVVIVLLLGTGSSGGAQAEKSTASSFCTQAAAVSNNNCSDRDLVTSGVQQRQVCANGVVWLCSGNYPNCTVLDKNNSPTSC